MRIQQQNKIRYLTPDHVKFVLGIDLPLNEGIDLKTENEIFTKQLLFEQWYKNLTQTAGKVFGKAKDIVTKQVKKKFLDKIQNIQELAEALTLIFQYPTLVNELNMLLSAEITRYSSPVIEFIQSLTTIGDDKIKAFVASSYQQINSLLTNFRSLKGWVKTMVGLAAFALMVTVWKKVEKQIKEIKKKFLQKTLGKSLTSLKGKILKKVAGTSEVGELGKNLTAGATEGLEQTFEDAVDDVFKKIGEVISEKAVAYIIKNAAAHVLSFLSGVAVFIGGVAVLAEILSPIVKQFIAKYNSIKQKEEQGVKARTASMGGDLSKQASTTDKLTARALPYLQAAQQTLSALPLEEQQIKLADILYR